MELLPETLGALEVAYIIETAGDAAMGDDDKRWSVRRSVVNAHDVTFNEFPGTNKRKRFRGRRKAFADIHSLTERLS
jgi:hypothetical protein